MVQRVTIWISTPPSAIFFARYTHTHNCIPRIINHGNDFGTYCKRETRSHDSCDQTLHVTTPRCHRVRSVIGLYHSEKAVSNHPRYTPTQHAPFRWLISSSLEAASSVTRKDTCLFNAPVARLADTTSTMAVRFSDSRCGECSHVNKWPSRSYIRLSGILEEETGEGVE